MSEMDYFELPSPKQRTRAGNSRPNDDDRDVFKSAVLLACDNDDGGDFLRVILLRNETGVAPDCHLTAIAWHLSARVIPP